jgi:hypothetical protein
LLTLGTWLAFFAAAIYAGEAALQLHEMTVATEATKKAAEVAERSLDESSGQFDRQMRMIINQTSAQLKSAQTAKESLDSVQRAFVYANPIITPVYANDGKTNGVFIQIALQNSGNTPTKEMRFHISRSNEAKIPVNYDFPDIYFKGKKRNPVDTFLGPKGVSYIGISPVDTKILKAIFEDKFGYTIWGWVRYRDIFLGSEEHVTMFCYELTAPGSYQAFANPQWTYTPQINNCATHNCADNQCKGITTRTVTLESKMVEVPR